MSRSLIAAGMAALLAGLPVVASASPHGAGPAAVDECDWASFGNGPDNTNAARAGCSDVNVTSVSTLQPRLVYRTRDSVTATPVVVDGTLYAGAWDGTVYAFPADVTGLGDPSLDGSGLPVVEPLWQFDTTEQDENDVAFGRIVGTPAVTDVGEERVVIVPAGATVFVLDAGRGEPRTSLCLDPRDEDDAPSGRCGGSDDDIEIESSPVVTRVGGETFVTIGLDVHNAADVGRTGIVHLRLDPDTGDGMKLVPLWKFDPEQHQTEPGTGTYRGEALLTSGSGTGDGCGGVWGTPAVDDANGMIVFGTASCKLAGDDLDNGDVAGESVFALDLDGNFLWRHDPPRPWGTRTDDDFGSSAQLFTIDDQTLVGIGDKQGWYYALDVDTGKPKWTTAVGQPGHLNEDFAIGGIIGTPAVGQATVFDPESGGPVETTAIFVTTAISTPVGQPLGTGTPDQWVDASLVEDPARMLSLHAIDARDGTVLWRSPITRQTYAHPSYANGVVLVPSTAGLSVQAFEASTGALLWTSPMNGAPSSGVAVVGDRIYLGAGTRQTDAGYKAFAGDSVLAGLAGEDPQERLAGIWAFELAG